MPISYWKPNKIWDGQTAFILGGGPSLKTTNLLPIHDGNVIGVNNSYRLGDWVDFCWFGDFGWWKRHRKELKSFKGTIAHCNHRTDMLRHSEIKHFKRIRESGINVASGQVSWNACSGSSAINFAYHLGATTIVLIGFDMRQVGGNKNWHNEHIPKNIEPATMETHLRELYGRFLSAFPAIALSAKSLGLKIINCTPGSAITDFPIMSLDEFISKGGI